MLQCNRVLTFVLLVLALGALAPAASAQAPARGREFPNFTATDAISGEKFSLEDFRGKVVIVDFWATWCGPCIRELPNVKSVYRKYKDKGLVIVSISLDRTGDRRKFETFVRRQKMTWYHVMEGGQWKTRLAKKYGIRSIPAMYVLDHEGVCIAVKPRDKALERAVKQAIGRLPGGGAEPGGSEPGRGAPRAAANLDEDMRTAGNAVQAAAAVLRPLPQKLQEADSAIDKLDEELPLPRRPEIARHRYEQLCETLREIRRELFVHGMLNNRAIALPENPFVGEDVDVKGALIAAKSQLKTARAAADEMQVMIMRLEGEVDLLERDLRRLERSRRNDGAAARECRQIRKEAEALRDAWMKQLRGLDDVMADLTARSPAASGLVDELAERVETCRRRLPDAGRDSGTQEKLSAIFGSLCDELGALVENLVRINALEAGEVELPDNPFRRGSMREMRNRIEAEGQIEKAEAAVEAIRRAMSGSGDRFAVLDEQLGLLQAELAAAEEAARLSELENQFRQWCDRFLAALDGAEGESS